MTISANKTGLSLGIFLAIIHTIWSIIISTGYGQDIFDWIFSIHMLENQSIMVLDFDWMSMLMLIGFTFVIGYVLGAIFALVWNLFYKDNYY